MEILTEEYQETGSEHSEEKSQQIIAVIEEGPSSVSENALMIRPIAGPLQVLTSR